MGIISIVSIFLVFFSLIATAVTGRKQWLVIWIWLMPVLGLIYHVRQNSVEIDGLVVLICGIMSMEIGYSIWGVKLWCVQTRKNNRMLSSIITLVNFALTYYCISQSLTLGYFGAIQNESKISILIIAVIISLVLVFVMQDITISTVDKYFSKKEEFSLINCKSTNKRMRRIYNSEFYRKYAIQGIQNGQEYVFHMTRKAYLILKQQKSFVFNARRGILGGVYVSSRVYDGDSKRRLKRVNKLLVRRAILVLCVFILAILFVVRIQTGKDFETILSQIGRGVMDWIK